ncbi:MAG: hypothetical protein WBA30_22115 [Priestia megaterium]|uniref:hypothetical protein n=1 Tax=Priestia megaterium TaxID=1404 RepID=UPI0013F4DB58|nr:hypothetical protein [Priestia megaterium]
MIKNPTRSDFFMVMVNVGLLYVGLQAVNWRARRRLLPGKARPCRSGSNEEARRPLAESEVLYGNPQRCNKRDSYELIYPICSSLD